jgi:hypothetical protein
LEQALQVMHQAGAARLDLDAIDMQPLSESVGSERGIHAERYVLWVRLGGFERTLLERIKRLDTALGDLFSLPSQIITGVEEAQIWQQAREMTWAPPEYALIKVPLTPKRITNLEAAFKEGREHRNKQVLRRYSVAGQVAWLACPAPLDDLASLLVSQNLAGLVLLDGSAIIQAESSLDMDALPAAVRPAMLGRMSGEAFWQRVKSALDPAHRFSPAG